LLATSKLVVQVGDTMATLLATIAVPISCSPPIVGLKKFDHGVGSRGFLSGTFRLN
jgi:hypothetical protein